LKHVVSVSLGSSTRNHTVETDFLGEKFKIERIGTDGDWDKAINLIRRLDGQVDAFGMGGITLYLYVGDRRYVMKDAKKMVVEARKTPIVDGGGLKNILEKQSIERVVREGVVDFKDRRVLMVCAVERLGMAQVLSELSGGQIVFGDLIYGLGLPIRVRSLKSLERLARVIAPIVINLPFDSLYPTGSKQDVIIPKFSKYYYEADIIAGDFLYIRRYLPERLDGKVIITNTTTQDDVKLLQDRGVSLLVTTTPEMEGRSFGTNVVEALLVSIIGKPVDQITNEDYRSLLRELDFRPGVTYLNGQTG